MKKLRIGMLASNFIRIPPDPPEKYIPPAASGAPEIIIYTLTEELVRRGHDVTLFASGDTQTSAHLVSVTEQATSLTMGAGPHLEYERLLISKAYQHAAEHQFDLMHSHYDLQSAYFTPFVKTPTLQTLHSPLEGVMKDILSHYKQTQHYASISNYQRTGLPDLKYAATVYNGISVASIPFNDTPEQYLIHAGRVYPPKGAAEAIGLARQAHIPLHLFGSADKASHYWLKEIAPQLDDTILYKGMVSRQALFTAFSKARAFLFPLQWDEPFGLAMIEAMATGTPVIAYRRGAVPEVVIDGKTGFIVDTPAEMLEAVHTIDQIDRAACRAHVEELFSIEKMADGYEQAYSTLLHV